MRKHMEHLYCKLGTFGKNCLAAVVFLSFLAAFFSASAFGFRLQIKIAEFLFG